LFCDHACLVSALRRVIVSAAEAENAAAFHCTHAHDALSIVVVADLAIGRRRVGVVVRG
jgi:hypothetical protein